MSGGIVESGRGHEPVPSPSNASRRNLITKRFFFLGLNENKFNDEASAARPPIKPAYRPSPLSVTDPLGPCIN